MKIFNIILFFIFSFNLLIGQSEKEFIEHQIKKGETLWHLSMIYNIPIDSIKKWNDIDIKSDKILADKSLFIKLDNALDFKFKELYYHIVQKGEYLGEISSMYNLSMDSIIKWNKKSNNMIYEDEILFLYSNNKIQNRDNPKEDDSNLNKLKATNEVFEQDTSLSDTIVEFLIEEDIVLDSIIFLSKADSLTHEINILKEQINASENWLEEWMYAYKQKLSEIDRDESNEVLKKLHLSKRKAKVQDSIQFQILNLKSELEFYEIELLKQEFLEYLDASEDKQAEGVKDTLLSVKIDSAKNETIKFDSKKLAFTDAQKIDVIVFDSDISSEKTSSKSKRNERFQKKIEKEIEQEVDEIISLDEVVVKDSRKEKYKIGEKVDEMSRQKAEFYLMRAKRELDNQSYKKAEKLINQSLDINPSYIEAYMIKGDLYALFQFYDKALENYEKAKILDRNSPQIYYNIGNCLIRKGKSGEALASMRKAISIDSTYILGYYGRSIIYLEKKLYKKAINDFNQILELNAYFFPAVKGRGIAHLNKGDYKDAIIDFNTVLNFDPKDEKTYYLRGLAKLYLENLYEGCMDLLKASEMGYSLADKDLKKYCK